MLVMRWPQACLALVGRKAGTDDAGDALALSAFSRRGREGRGR